jgi:hypothetical protein
MIKKKNISNNFRGKEDVFWIKIKKGIKKFLEPAFNKDTKQKRGAIK